MHLKKVGYLIYCNGPYLKLKQAYLKSKEKLSIPPAQIIYAKFRQHITKLINLNLSVVLLVRGIIILRKQLRKQFVSYLSVVLYPVSYSVT